MDEINYNELVQIVIKTTKSSYHAYEHHGQLVPNVANLGAKKGNIAKLERKGEYFNIAIEFMEDARPLLTNKFVIRILTLLKKEDYVTPLTLLGLTTPDELKYILHKWLQIATTGYNNQIGNSEKKYTVYDRWIKSVTHDPLLCKIKIAEIGSNQNTGHPVVPEDWIGREFNNADALHAEMDKLESRIGKAPVTFAVIYSMIIQKTDSIIKNIKNIEYQYIFYLDLVSDNLISKMVTKKRKDYTTEIYNYVKYGNILIGFKLDDILEPKAETTGPKEVGLLVSRLQKAMRRGRYASKAIIETIDALNESPNYNLPEHNFLRVSAAKQLAWRLFITILEDCRPYQPIEELGLLELILLVLVTQKVLEYKFTKPILDLIKLTALLAQYNDSEDDLGGWRKLPVADKTPIIENSDYHTALSLALDNIIMMSGDNRMLRKYYSDKDIFEPFMAPNKLKPNKWKKSINKKYIFHDPDVYTDVVLSSYDMHVKPYIILYYQACIPISMTTKQISGYIWDVSSSYNIRLGKNKPVPDPVLRDIQKYFYSGGKSVNDKSKNEPIEYKNIYDNVKPSIHIKRSTFLVLFGKKYWYKGKEVILAGTKQTPARIKIDNEWTYYSDVDILNAYPDRTIMLSSIDPPEGFKWIKNKVITKIVDGKPKVDNKEIPYFDGSSLVKPVVPIITKSIDKKMYSTIMEVFSGLDVDFGELINIRTNTNKEIRNWIPKKSDRKKINHNLVRLVYMKLFNNMNNLIMIGPINRGGDKMQNSINYLLEGKIWAVFNLFCYLYPDTIKPNGVLNFNIKKDTSGYIHLVQSLQKIIFRPKTINGIVPKIKTKLWDHQKESVNKIVTGFSKGKRGFGDASDVGSGKTLTSLGVAVELIKTNDQTYCGILVLLPGNNLITTWRDELAKHTKGFDIKYQSNNNKIGNIQRNTIIITTMARIRDHPINHKWLLVIIDECLSVQNRNALWTQAAWMQSLMSKHLVMMSATFFRTRFDKLYYMLKMLQSGLPEERDYLDTILLETIVSQVSKVKRTWTSNNNYFILDDDSRKEYDKIDKSDLNTEVKFSKLTSFLVNNAKANTTVVSQLSKLIKKLEKDGKQCLIYAYSMAEASLWSEYMDIPIYPKKGTHCIVTYHNGTYGLNDLVIYNCIVLRPPAPDLIPQIKGRLDRMNQKENDLYIEYFVLKDTIEEGLILRLNIASQFIQKYIMPISKFYDISVNHKKYLGKEID